MGIRGMQTSLCLYNIRVSAKNPFYFLVSLYYNSLVVFVVADQNVSILLLQV